MGTAEFVIVRHGNTFDAGEAPRRIGWRTDLPLTESGTAQAEALGAHFAELGWRFARALVSPLLRTTDTAGRILQHQENAPALESCEWLREVDHGPDENQPEPSVVARIGREALAAWDERGEPPPGWTVDAEARCSAWRALFGSEPAGGPVLIVTSNGAARYALLANERLSAKARALGGLKLATGSYGVVARRADGGLQVPVWGRRP
ncbi:histidine phosphatase family protein [Novosphingobium sp. M1R2S20]|uniref:Histidine phosphatase family protein n=1 Tax=Novosphingobium rhizovicinum TaxID=3228928 RepID=A0ABV3RB83_9SPHN